MVVIVMLMFYAVLDLGSEKVATCSSCNTQIEVTDRYCAQCGVRQEYFEQAETPQTTQWKDVTKPEGGE